MAEIKTIALVGLGPMRCGIAQADVRMHQQTVHVRDAPGFLIDRIDAAFRPEVYRRLLEGGARISKISTRRSDWGSIVFNWYPRRIPRVQKK